MAGVKAHARPEARAPGGGKAQEGIGWMRRLNPGVCTTDSDTDQSPEGGAQGSGAGGKLLAAELGQRREGTRRRRADAAVAEGKSLKSEPWTW